MQTKKERQYSFDCHHCSPCCCGSNCLRPTWLFYSLSQVCTFGPKKIHSPPPILFSSISLPLSLFPLFPFVSPLVLSNALSRLKRMTKVKKQRKFIPSESEPDLSTDKGVELYANSTAGNYTFVCNCIY